MSMTRALVLGVIGVLASLGCTLCPEGELETHKELVLRFTEIANAADWDALAEVVADDFVRHSAATEGPPVTSRDAFIELQKSFLVGFPDQRVTVQELIAERDRVAARATYSATHTGPMGDIPATGKTIESPFLAVFRIEHGKIAELWVEWDNVAMMKQLGLFPPPETAAPTG
jgi:steroid delta-isomerase-like uncharacterized protein